MQTKIILLFAILSLSACQLVYQKPVQQGNVLKSALVDQIHKGYSRSAVVNLLGEPAITQMDNNRWVYLEEKRLDGKWESKKLVLRFKDDRVTGIETE